MLRITICEGCSRVDLKLEGRLTGVWVAELEEAWRGAQDTAAERPLLIDLAGVSHVDRAGEYLLALLQERGTDLRASGAATAELVRRIAENWTPAAKEGQPEPLLGLAISPQVALTARI